MSPSSSSKMLPQSFRTITKTSKKATSLEIVFLLVYIPVNGLLPIYIDPRGLNPTAIITQTPENHQMSETFVYLYFLQTLFSQNTQGRLLLNILNLGVLARVVIVRSSAQPISASQALIGSKKLLKKNRALWCGLLVSNGAGGKNRTHVSSLES